LYLLSGCRQSTELTAPSHSTPAPIVTDTVAALAKADSLFSLAQQLLIENKSDSSRLLHEQALALRENLLMEDVRLVASYFAIGRFYEMEFKYDAADAYYEKGRMLAERIPAEPAHLVNWYLRSIACKVNLFDFTYANSLIQKLMQLAARHFPDDKTIHARIYSNLAGNFYYQKDFEQAFAYQNKVIQLIPPDDYRRLGNAFNTIGVFYNSSGDYLMAIRYFNKAISYHLKWTHAQSDPVAIVYVQKGGAHLHIGQIDSAYYCYRMNLAIRRKEFGEKHVNTYGAYRELAEFNYAIGRWDSSAYYYQHCLVSLIKSFHEKALSENPRPDVSELNTDLINGLVGKARALRKLSEAQTDQPLLLLALKTFQLADSVFSEFRASMAYEEVQLRQLEEAYVPYHEMADIAFELYQKKKEDAHLEAVLNTMERSRAVLLQSTLQKAETYSSLGVDKNYREEEGRLLRQRNDILKKLDTLNADELMKSPLHEALLHANEALARLKSEVATKNPEYVRIKYRSNDIEIIPLQKFLHDHQSFLVEFLWNEKTIYALLISPDTVIMQRIGQDSLFKEAFRQFSTELAFEPEEVYRMDRFRNLCNASHTLYRYLLSGLLGNNETDLRGLNMIISADGPLATVPFEALITSLPKTYEVDYHLPYLMLSYPVSYTYSSGLWVEHTMRERKGKKLLALGFAGDGKQDQRRDGYGNLPGTEWEIKAIKEVMKNTTNQYYLEDNATESLFKREAVNFDVVHLALHGVGDTVNAMESRLIFRLGRDTLNDGYLYAHELYDLNLDKLDLAVLSACESGVGKQQAGEGVMSIARGFAYAGCPSLVISLWKINDHSSATVMANFYRHLSGGEPLNVSLSKAKQDYYRVANEFNSHPYYWAAFQLVGDVKPMQKGGMIWIWVAAAIAVVVLYAARKYLIHLNQFFNISR
jgi:CHAT domain-containing protein